MISRLDLCPGLVPVQRFGLAEVVSGGSWVEELRIKVKEPGTNEGERE